MRPAKRSRFLGAFTALLLGTGSVARLRTTTHGHVRLAVQLLAMTFHEHAACGQPGPEIRAEWPAIVKHPAVDGIAPNMRDYDPAWAEFSWNEARRRLDGLPGGAGLNIAHEAVDRHTAGLHGNRVALRWLSRSGARRDFTYDDLRGATSRFANVLNRLGVGAGEVVATLAGRIPYLYIAALGTLKNRSVYTPLFSAFGPDPIVSRMTIARARVLVTTDTLYRRKVEPVRAQMPALEHVLLVRETSASASGTRRRRPSGC